MPISIRRTRETGFTLIELLTVIIIIGILAAIAIPVFSSQRSRAQDSQTVSDVRNIVTAAETVLADRTKSFDDVIKNNLEFASSKNVSWNIKGSNTLGGYCIVAENTSGKKWKGDNATTILTYDSVAGGLDKRGTACPTTGANAVGTANTDYDPNGSTAVGSLTATPAVADRTFNNSSTGYTGTLQTYAVTVDGDYQIKAYGAQGGSDRSGNAGGLGAYATATVRLTAGQNLTVLVGQKGSNGVTSPSDTAHFTSGGGGGGTFVTVGTGSSATALVVAGGGTGAHDNSSGNYLVANNGLTTNNGTTNGGSAYDTNSSGGAGFLGNGSSNSFGTPAYSFANGGNGGSDDNGDSTYIANGGYGGGSSSGHIAAGAGGGYNGGYAGQDTLAYPFGGGSYTISGTYNGRTVTGNATNNTTMANSGHGSVVISKVG